MVFIRNVHIYSLIFIILFFDSIIELYVVRPLTHGKCEEIRKVMGRRPGGNLTFCLIFKFSFYCI